MAKNFDYFKIGSEVHYNWGYGSPEGVYKTDHFTALFDQSKEFSSGDYFIQTTADNGVKVEVDGNWKIERWTDDFDTIERELWLNVKEGHHSVKTHYYDDVFGAAVYSDIVPFDSWLAYYYPNQDLKGSPINAKVISPNGITKKLTQNIGYHSPHENVPKDHFSARYTTIKYLPEGEYMFRTVADDGVRVYLDGKLVLDGWKYGAYGGKEAKITVYDRNVKNSSEKDIHEIEVQYYEIDGASKIDFDIVPTNEWIGYYKNKGAATYPVIVKGIKSLSYNWNWGSPHPSVPIDQFETKFEKSTIMAGGDYFIQTTADNGVKVQADNQPKISRWTNGFETIERTLWLDVK
ncbi:galactose oxidase, partial [Bacillaceae bacterium Marseille-Q3522]|nr:galactose oxidase [Bacillaceae bacterium Marseille-Q3522]